MSGLVFTHSDYAHVMMETFENCAELARLKGSEYSGDTDRLANFRRNGAAIGLPMEAIWYVYAAKHWDALTQSILDKTHGKTRERLEPLEGRIDDLIVYLVLLKCMMVEAKNQ